MTTYADLQRWVKGRYGFVPKTCWIAHVRELSGLKVRVAPNRADSRTRMVPCPPEKIQTIRAALVHFGIVDSASFCLLGDDSH